MYTGSRDQVLPLTPLPGHGVFELRIFAPNSERQHLPLAAETLSFPSAAPFMQRVRGVNVHGCT